MGTPDKNKQKNEIIVSFSNKTGEETKMELKKHITTKELQTGFRGIRVLKNGSVVVECKTAEQKEAVKEKMQTVKTAEIKEGVRLNPRIKLIGLPSNVKGEEIIQDIINENEEIKTLIEEHPEAKHIKIIKNIPWTGKFQRQNWILEVAPQIFSRIMKERTVIVDMLRYRVEETTSVLICMRCCRYGHSHRNCTATEPACYKCGEKHEGNSCKTEEHKCINCVRAGKTKTEELKHKATDYSCPQQNRKRQDNRRITDYGC